jgi:uncharacterized protein (TIGR00369 family)
MRPLGFGRGTSEWEWHADQDWMLNPFGYVSGGYVTVFADEILASAIGSLLGDGEAAATAELKISFLKAVPRGLVRGQGRVLRKGRRVAFVEAHIGNAKGDPLAVVSSTWTILDLEVSSAG